MLGALMQSPRSRRGLTIIELMVVVGVVAVLAALAAPSLRDFMARQRVAAINAELVTDLQFARSEAVSRNRDVYVTFRTDDRAGQPPMTCYTVHTRGTVGNCDCRKPLGTACPNLAETRGDQDGSGPALDDRHLAAAALACQLPALLGSPRAGVLAWA